MKKSTRREVLAGLGAFAVSTAMAQQAKQTASKSNPLGASDWGKVLPEIKELVNAATPLTDRNGNPYYMVNYKGAECRVDAFSRAGEKITSLLPLYPTEENLLGSPSGFISTVSENVKFKTDVQQIAKLPEEEKEKIQSLIDITDQIAHHHYNYPNCIPSDSDLADGSKSSGSFLRSPYMLAAEDTSTERRAFNRLLALNNVTLSPLQRQIYGILGYPTTTEDLARIKFQLTDNPSPSICSPYVGLSLGSCIYRALERYPSGTEIRKTLWEQEIQMRRRFALLGTAKKLKEIGAGNSELEKFSSDGQAILGALARHCEQMGRKVEKFKGTETHLKPKGIVQ